MKVKILVSLLFATVSAQWVLINGDSPPLLTTDASAKPNASSSCPMWSNGKNLYLLNDRLWKYEIDHDRWLWQPDVPILTPRKYAASWTIRGIFYLYGGLDRDGNVLNDMWTYDPVGRVAKQIFPLGGSALPLYGSSYWVHEQSNRLYQFGGLDKNTTFSILRAYDIVSGQWSTIQYSGVVDASPFASATLYDGNQVYLYSNDRLWRLDLSSLMWNQVATGTTVPPGPVRMHHILWSYGTNIYLYGGESGSKLYGDIWKIGVGSGGSPDWSRQADKLIPPARSSPSYTVDTYGSLFISGGGDYNDIWGFGPISELSLLEKLENGLQSAVLWSFISAIVSGLILFGFILLILYICISKCVARRTKIRNGHIPLTAKTPEEFMSL